MSYFKTSDVRVQQARATYIEQCRRVQREADRFASCFAFARAVCAGDLEGRRFIGLSFTQPVDHELWQCAGRDGVYEPRIELPESVTPERTPAVGEQLGALRLKWVSERPYFQADLGPLKTLLGLAGVDEAQGLRFHYVDGLDGCFYFHAHAQAGNHCTEITEAEFFAAELRVVQRQGRHTDARERARIL